MLLFFHTGASGIKQFALYTPPLCFSFLFWAKPPSSVQKLFLKCQSFLQCVYPHCLQVCVCVCSLFWAKPPSRLVCSKAVSKVSVCKWCGYVRVCVHACVCVRVCVCVHAYVRACVRLKGTLHSHFTWKMGQYTTVVCYFQSSVSLHAF